MAAEYLSAVYEDGAFVFTAQAIADIQKVALEYIGREPDIAVQLEGSHTIQSKNLDELISDIYVKSRNIHGVEISGHSERATRHIDVNLGGTSISPVYFRISGDRDASIKARTQIGEIIDGRKQWYSILGSNNLPLIGWVLFSVAMAVLAAYAIHGMNIVNEGDKTFITVRGGPLGIGMAIVEIGVIIWLCLLARLKGFPRLLFDVGRAADRVRSAAVWRNVFFGIVVLGLARPIRQGSANFEA
jgi:hypothetical protein